jgi:hypothetical protein
MRGVGLFSASRMATLAGLAAASLGVSAIGSDRNAIGSIVLPAVAGLTEEDRRRRNLKAGGRDKRIKRDKAWRSFGYGRKRASRGCAVSKPFLRSDARNAAFLAAIEAGKSHNQALKLARREAA